MTEITGKILENALCFIYESVKRMDRLEKNQSLTEANQNLKYAICHLFSGTSLLLKARLSKEHWSFIFEDINEATEKKLNSGDFQGIKLKSCQNRLSNICSIELDEKQKNVLETLRKKRNEAEHFFIIERESVWKSRLSEVLVLILDFKEKYLKECLIKDEEIKKESMIILKK